MNKLWMRPATALSRYHQQFRFFMNDDGPNLNDHDFSNPGYLLVPSGYRLLMPKEISEVKRSEDEEEFMADILDNIDGNHQPDDDPTGHIGSEEPAPASFKKDKLKRPHYPRLEAGPGLVKLRACEYDTPSGETHSNDISSTLSAQVSKDKKGMAFLKVDNGSDWNLHSLVNVVYFCRVFKNSKLDVLGNVSYAAKYSAFDNIELLWSPMSKKLQRFFL